MDEVWDGMKEMWGRDAVVYTTDEVLQDVNLTRCIPASS